MFLKRSFTYFHLHLYLIKKNKETGSEKMNANQNHMDGAKKAATIP